MTQTAFSELNLDPRIEKAVAEMGFEDATPVQAEAIPLIRTGVDVIARSQTGTGKTVAFAIPSLEIIDTDEPKPTVQVLMLCPTRELAQQAADEVRKLAQFMPGIRPVEVYGGADMQRQFIRLRRANLVVGTPGRVMDHMRRGTLKLENVKMIVLDEADEMLKMGLKEDIETILLDTPDERQTVLFSATMPPPILALTKKFQRDPQLIEINKSQVTIENIDQRFVEVPALRKSDALSLSLRYHQPNRVLVFCNTKRMVDELADFLRNKGYAAESIHGDLKQSQRTSVMTGFKKGKVAILVATDVAARGIDVNDLDYVINYDIPLKSEEYVHRIGRTGRAGRSGSAITLCCGRRQVSVMREIARAVKSEIRQEMLPTPADMKDRDEAHNLEILRTALTQEGIASYTSLVESLVGEGYTPTQVATAALSICFPAEEIEAIEVPAPVSHREGSRGERVHAPKKGSRGGSSYVDLIIDVGSASRVTPGHLVGAITERAGVSGKEIGKITISAEQSIVGVSAERVDEVLNAMRGCKICGKPTRTMELPGGGGDRREKSHRKDGAYNSSSRDRYGKRKPAHRRPKND